MTSADMSRVDVDVTAQRPEARGFLEAYVEASARVLRGPDTRILTFDGVWLVDYGEPVPGRTREVVAANLEPEAVAETLEEALPDGHHALTVVAPTPEAVIDHYAHLGYRLRARRTLTGRDLSVPLPDPGDADVRAVASAEDARRVDDAFGWRLIREAYLDDPFLAHYYALADGTPVARATVARTATGVAVVDAVATLPAYRGRGLGRAVVTRGLEDVRREGATLALLARGEDAPDFPRRLGFEDVAPLLTFEPA